MGRGALSQSGQCLLSYSLISLIRAEPPEGERARARPRGGPARGDRRGTGGGGRFGAIGPKCLRIRMFRYCSLASLVPAMSRPCRSSWEGGWSPTARMLGNIRVIGLSRLYRSRKSFKASRLTRCGTGVPMFHRGKDFRVLKYWGTELRTAETLVCTRCPCPKILGHGIAVAGILPASCLRWGDYQVTDVPFQRDYQHNRGHSAAGGGWPKDQHILTTRMIVRQQRLTPISADYQCNRWPQHIEHWPPIKKLSANVSLRSEARLWAFGPYSFELT